MQKKLILVGNKETDVYCEYLSMLVSTCDDHNDGEKQIIVGVPDGTVDTAIWTNEIYRDNRAHTSSRQKFLFIGDDGAVKNVIPNIDFFEDESEDKQCGIFYGWLGNKAVIYINESAVKDERIYDRIFPQFRKLGEEYNRKISEAIFGSVSTEYYVGSLSREVHASVNKMYEQQLSQETVTKTLESPLHLVPMGQSEPARQLLQHSLS